MASSSPLSVPPEQERQVFWHAWLARSNLRKVKSSSDVPRVVLTRHLAFRKRLGIVFQNFLLIGNGTLLHNVLCGRLGRYPWWRTLAGFSRADRHEAFKTLDGLGLAGHVHRRAFEVSGGEQQRAALARALFQEPEMFLADEPVSNLDPDLTLRVLEILRAQTRQDSRTVVCVLHDQEMVERFADMVITLNPEPAGGVDPSGDQTRR